jgi:hypothetical protein
MGFLDERYAHLRWPSDRMKVVMLEMEAEELMDYLDELHLALAYCR